MYCGGGRNDYAGSAVELADGTVALACMTASASGGDIPDGGVHDNSRTDVWLMRVDPAEETVLFNQC